MKTFLGGIHPDYNKELASGCIISELPAPDKVYISVSQHLGAPAEPVVAVGDTVEMGQLIARASSAMSANIFSSVSGTVEKIVEILSITGRKEKTIIIANDGQDTIARLPALSKPDAAAILDRIKDAGIVGMGGAGFPTAVKLVPPKDKVVDTLLINGAECEPYINCDYRIMLEYTEQVVKGAALFAEALGIENILMCIEVNKQDAIDRVGHFISKLQLPKVSFTVVPLEVKYPQGAERQLIRAATGRVVGKGELPFDVGCIVSNVHTVFSSYLAVYDGQPLYKRVVTVSGKGIERTGNYLVRIGTRFSHIIEQCGGYKTDEQGNPIATRLISGGPMMGVAAAHDEHAVTKTTSSILLLTKSEAPATEPSNCINCAKCTRVCPMGLMPMYIDSYAMSGDYVNAKRYGAPECIECGCCAFICPAKRPLVQAVKRAKAIVKERKI